MTSRLILCLLLALGSGAQAQVLPEPSGGDPRIQAVDYRRDQVVQIGGAPGYQTTIALAPDEQIQNIAVGDSGAWQVSANRSGNILFVKPVQGGVDTNMTIVTNARFYAFDLVAAGNSQPPYEVRFRYPAEEGAQAPDTATPAEQIGRYRLGGSRMLRPDWISDDGEKTWIRWREDVALPAVFIVDESGRERLANGNMRGDLYVIDSVHAHLMFRIDRETAHARRFLPREQAK